jgi:hypothetical protein
MIDDGFIYLMHVREFMHTNIYKIGRTENILKRVIGYPKGSRLLLGISTRDMKTIEKVLIKEFSILFKARPDIGREYFEGEKFEMMKKIMECIEKKESDPLDLPEEVEINDKKIDPAVVVMEFVDEERAILSDRVIKSKDVYMSLQDFIEKRRYNVFVSHTMMTRVMVKSYGVISKSHRFGDEVDQGLEIPNLYTGERRKEEKEDEVIFDRRTCLIDRDKYEELKLKPTTHLTALEELQRWIYHMSMEVWKLPSINSVSREFFENYIGQYNQNSIKKAYERYNQMMRTNDFLENTLDENIAQYHEKLNNIRVTSEESKIELFNTKSANNYNRMIEGHRLLIALGISASFLLDNDEVLIESKDVEAKVRSYLSTISDYKFASLLSIFDLKKETYKNKEMTINSGQKLNSFVKQALKVCFNMQVGTNTRGIMNPLLRVYDNPTRSISIASYNVFKDEYRPLCFVKPL